MDPLGSVQPMLGAVQAALARQAEAAQSPPRLADLTNEIDAPSLRGSPASPAESFDNVLGRLVEDVNARQLASADAVNGLLSGSQVSLHQTVLAMEEASVSFQLMVEVRNKLLESYQELMRMQV